MAPSLIETEPTRTLKSSSRNGFLDVLRALAIVLVINCHVATTLIPVGSHANRGWLLAVAIGGHGVDLFFVLSGWLLGRLLLEELVVTGSIDVGRFYGRRWLRTLPAYYAVLALTLLQRAIQQNTEPADASYLFFLQTYVYDTLPFLGVTWSLCVEEHFYLFVAPVLLLVGAHAGRAAVAFGALLIAPAFMRALLDSPDYTQSHLRVDQCAIGVMLAYIYVQHSAVWKLVLQAAPAVAVVGMIALVTMGALRASGSPSPEPYALFSVVFASWVALSERGEWWRNFGADVPIVSYVATRSYSLYLLHPESIALAERIGLSGSLLLWPFVWGLSFVLAEILYRAVEKPGMDLRKRIKYLRRRDESSIGAG